ncbi:MAG: hypothetical protein JXB39_11615 [Deltaproteobacteria bacterium]|nr:hypothetical protein [Deltaproteobacteria bacterium]
MRTDLSGTLALLLVLTPGVAVAASHDVTLSRLGEWSDWPLYPTDVTDAYTVVVNELGLAIANKPVAPAETLGIYGFDLGVSSTVAFISSHDDSAGQPGPWSRVDPAGDPAAVLWIPWVHVRKGLPLSLEVGANAGYLAFTHQTAVGGYGRWGLVEGYAPIPDLAIQVGYAGYVGNDELELGVMDLSATVGYTVPFGSIVGIHQARFSPFLGVGSHRIHAAPRLGAERQASLGVSEVSGFQRSKVYDPAFEHTTVDGGFCIWSSDFQLRLAATWTPGSLVTLTGGLGFAY